MAVVIDDIRVGDSPEEGGVPPLLRLNRRHGRRALAPGGALPAAAAPGAAAPARARPAVAAPGAAAPACARPAVAAPGHARPGVAAPGRARPGSTRPGIARPGGAGPAAAVPTAARPACAGGLGLRHRRRVERLPEDVLLAAQDDAVHRDVIRPAGRLEAARAGRGDEALRVRGRRSRREQGVEV